MSIVKVENLTKVYGKGSAQVTALDNVSFEVPKGQFLAIVGPSGSGKEHAAPSFGRRGPPHLRPRTD